MIVVDASVLLEVLLRTPAGIAIEPRLFRARETYHAPHLVDVECLQVLRRLLGRGEMTERRAVQAMRDLQDFPLERYPHHPFAERIWALRENLSAYDAAYVALAEALDAPLLTRDARLANAPGNRTSVELIA